MSVLIKDMEMPTECHGCRWFYFQGTSCTEPKYYLDARCEMVESGQDWYGKDARGGWIGESIEHIPGWSGNYSHQHCVEMGTRASQCPLCELPSAQPEIIYCKKCKHWTETCGDKQWGLGDCDVFDKHLVMCNGYCAWAERREE